MARAVEHDWDAEYTGDTPPPWEIGEPQPAIAAVLDQLRISDPVLDVGCGTGALTRELARRGHQVIGVDFSAPAIAEARAKAAAEDLQIDFRIADATRLQDLGARPATVFDSGLLHSLDESGAGAYVAGLEEVCVCGATVCLLAMSAEGELGWGVTQDQLATLFAPPAWRSTTIDEVRIRARSAGEDLRPEAFLLITQRA